MWRALLMAGQVGNAQLSTVCAQVIR
jgi:hypothetical protein